MMLMPRRNYNLFDEMFDDPFFRGHEARTSLMKTDVLEKDGNYLLEMDLPGFTKDDIRAQLHDGYLTIQAEKKTSSNKKDENGKYVFRERHTGSCSRTFYVGDHVTQEDIKASFENGTLKLAFPKMTPEKIEAQKKYITIE